MTLLGFLGLATPNFLLALVLLYIANVAFGTSIGGLKDPEYLGKPWSGGKLLSVLEHLWVPVVVIGNVTVGGAGKTPAVIALASALAEAGLRPGIGRPRFDFLPGFFLPRFFAAIGFGTPAWIG